MANISFKSDDKFKKDLDSLAKYNGVNTSAYIKLLLTKEMKKELSQVTENGMTVAEELAILDADINGEVYGPFETVEALNKALSQ